MIHGLYTCLYTCLHTCLCSRPYTRSYPVVVNTSRHTSRHMPMHMCIVMYICMSILMPIYMSMHISTSMAIQMCILIHALDMNCPSQYMASRTMPCISGTCPTSCVATCPAPSRHQDSHARNNASICHAAESPSCPSGMSMNKPSEVLCHT